MEPREAGPEERREVISVEEAATRLGVSRAVAYALARTGQLVAGVPVLRLGQRRLVVPLRPLNRVLGIED